MADRSSPEPYEEFAAEHGEVAGRTRVSGVHRRSDCRRDFLEASIGRAWGLSGTHSSVSSGWPVTPRVHGNLRNHKLNTLLLASVFLSFKSGIWRLVLDQPVSSSRPA